MAEAEVVKQGDKWAVKQVLADGSKPSVIAVFEAKKSAEEYAETVNS